MSYISRATRLPWITAVAALALYLMTLSRHYSGDGIEYALAIESGQPAYLLDPYHPLLHPLGLAFWQLWQFLGWTGRSLLPLQVLNALGGAACVGLITALGRALTRSNQLAVLVAAGFAVSGGLWMLSVDAEFVTIPMALMLWVLLKLLAAPAGDTRQDLSHPLRLGLGATLAIFSYLTAAFLVPVALVGIASDPHLDIAHKRRQFAVYTAVVLIGVVPAYLWFLNIWSNGNWSQVVAIFSGTSYNKFTWFNLPHGVYAFLRSLLLYPHLSLVGTTRDYLAAAEPTGRVLFGVTYAIVGLIALTPPLLAIRQRRYLWPVQRRALLALAVWVALFSAFAFYWVPGDQTFWLPVLAAWWLLLALVASHSPTNHPPIKWLAIPIAALALANAAFEIVPRHNLSANHAYQLAIRAATHASGTDVILTRSDEITGLYAAYFGDQPVFFIADDSDLDAMLSNLEQPVTTSVIIISANQGQAGWWRALIDACTTCAHDSWQVRYLPWAPVGSLAVQLTKAAKIAYPNLDVARSSKGTMIV
jgi:hypothetical protein